MIKYQCWNCGAHNEVAHIKTGKCNHCAHVIPPERVYMAYFLDVDAHTLKMVAIDRHNSLNMIYDLLGCRHIDAVRLDETHVAYCDDEGLLREELPCFTTIEGMPHPLAGNLLFVGTNAHGDDCAPSMSLAELQSRLMITRGVFSPLLENIQTDDAVGVQLRALTLRPVTSAPAICA